MPVSGAVDAVLGRFVVGWAHDPQDLTRRVDVELELDGELVGTATADLERGDLLLAKIGDGCHAFRIELPRGLEPGSEHVLTVRASGEGVTLPLANDFVVEFESGRSGPAAIVSTPDPVRSIAAGVHAQPGAGEALPMLLGAEGWLYEFRESPVLDWLSGASPLPQEKVAAWRERLVQRADRLRELGVPYVVAVLPDKLTLYPEYLPMELRRARHGRAAELVAASLRDENGVELLDLLPALRDARAHGQLMPQTGTRLTWTGAFYAYRALAKELAKHRPSIRPLPTAALKLGVEVPVADSLAARQRFVLVAGQRVSVGTGLEAVETEAELVTGDLEATFVPMSRAVEEQLGRGASLLEVADPDVPESALVVHAGTGGRVINLVAEHFAQTLVTASGEVPYGAVEQEGVVIVLELIDELALCQ